MVQLSLDKTAKPLSELLCILTWMTSYLIDMVRSEDLPVHVTRGPADALRRVRVVLVQSGRAEVSGRASGDGQQERDQGVQDEEREGDRPTRVVLRDVLDLAP